MKRHTTRQRNRRMKREARTRQKRKLWANRYTYIKTEHGIYLKRNG